MKILVDVPDTTQAVFANYIFVDQKTDNTFMGCKTLDTYGVKKAILECQKKHPNGKWNEENKRPKSAIFVCSNCGGTAYYPQPNTKREWQKHCPYKYCPNCGAEMTEGKQ